MPHQYPEKTDTNSPGSDQSVCFGIKGSPVNDIFKANVQTFGGHDD